MRRLYIQSENVLEPPELCCPITHSLMLDCVSADDGNNYSRAGIEEWFAKGKTTTACSEDMRFLGLIWYVHVWFLVIIYTSFWADTKLLSPQSQSLTAT